MNIMPKPPMIILNSRKRTSIYVNAEYNLPLILRRGNGGIIVLEARGITLRCLIGKEPNNN